MWHEARKQGKQIKTIMVDYKKRAERRMDYYEKIKQDPIKFLRVYGRRSKLHLDSEVMKTAENPNNMMKWIGDNNILIDRFDARANLEHYDVHATDTDKPSAIERIENRLCAYERYRCLIHNEYASVTEAMALKQIEVDEKYTDWEKRRKDEEEVAKKSQEPKAAIGFTYEDSDYASGPNTSSLAVPASSTTAPSATTSGGKQQDSDSEGEADSDMDIDVELDLTTLGQEGRRNLTRAAVVFGLHSTDFLRLLDADQLLETELRMAKALEEEKLQLGGRKSRRARRLFKHQRNSHEKGVPKVNIIKIGLLHGQPISRRTVYLSASSSDSGEYPSDVEDVVEDLSGWEKPQRGAGNPAISIAKLQQLGRSVKPMLMNTRGPAVLIGGMTSISLCRRRHRTNGRKLRATSSASSSASPDGRGRSSSSSRSSSERSNSRHSRHRHPVKRSRVKYITTFGEDDDDEAGTKDSASSVPKRDKQPGVAASAVAASVVSKLLQGSTTTPSSSTHSDNRDGRLRSPIAFKFGGPTVRHSPMQRSRHDASPRHHPTTSGTGRTTSTRQQRSGGRRRHSSSDSPHYRSGRDARGRTRPQRRPTSSSSSSSASTSVSSTARKRSHQQLKQQTPKLSSTSYKSGPVASRTSEHENAASPPPPVRRRYYRPELESDGESKLSDLDGQSESDSGDGDAKCRPPAGDEDNQRQPSSLRQDLQASPPRSLLNTSTAGKLPTSTQSTAADESVFAKTPHHVGDGKTSTAYSGTVRMTPQELLNRRVQLQLAKAFNADKKAEQEKQVQLERERQAREEGLRRQARLLRRQEEKRLLDEQSTASIISGGGGAGFSDSSSSSPSHPARSTTSSARPTLVTTKPNPTQSPTTNRHNSDNIRRRCGYRQRRISSSSSSSRSSVEKTHRKSDGHRSAVGASAGRLPSPPVATDGARFRGYPIAENDRPCDGRRSSPLMSHRRQHEESDWWTQKSPNFGQPRPHAYDQYAGPARAPQLPPSSYRGSPNRRPQPRDAVVDYPFEGDQRWQAPSAWDEGDPRRRPPPPTRPSDYHHGPQWNRDAVDSRLGASHSRSCGRPDSRGSHYFNRGRGGRW